MVNQSTDQTSGTPSPLWTIVFMVLRGTALLFALVGFADLLFFGHEYKRASSTFHTHYHAANWSLVILAFYPRFMFRLSGLFIAPLVIFSLVAAFEWNWLSQNEALSVAPGEAALKNAVAILALGFALEGVAAFVRLMNVRANRPVRKRQGANGRVRAGAPLDRTPGGP